MRHAEERAAPPRTARHDHRSPGRAAAAGGKSLVRASESSSPGPSSRRRVSVVSGAARTAARTCRGSLRRARCRGAEMSFELRWSRSAPSFTECSGAIDGAPSSAMGLAAAVASVAASIDPLWASPQLDGRKIASFFQWVFSAACAAHTAACVLRGR